MGKVVSFSLEAGGRGGRWASQREITNIQSEIRNSGALVRQRAQYFVQNTPFAAAAVSNLVSNIIGPGIKPLSRHPSRATRERLHEAWSQWIDDCDVTGQSDFYGLQAQVARALIVDGEAFVRFLVGDDGFPRLQLLHADQVGGPLAQSLASDGIEYDSWGRPIIYNVLPRRITDWTQIPPPSLNTIALPADQIAHVFVPVEPGQRRGLSWLAPVLLKIREYDGMDDAALASARTRNMIGAAITAGEGETQLRDAAPSWVPGQVMVLQPGEDIKLIEPSESAGYAEFMRAHLRAIAIGIGVPYEVLSGDLSQVNYSSIRAGMVEFGRRLQYWQHSILGRQLLRPVWHRFVAAAMLAGVLPPAKLDAARRAVEFQPPHREWVDPLKDVQAAAAAVDAGFTSRSAVISAMGYDAEVVDAEIAADDERAAGLGILKGRAVDAGQNQPVEDEEQPATEG